MHKIAPCSLIDICIDNNSPFGDNNVPLQVQTCIGEGSNFDILLMINKVKRAFS